MKNDDSRSCIIRNSYTVTNPHEISVDWGGNNYLVIYGQHINGGFCAIPNWNVSTELGTPDSVAYNEGRLAETLMSEGAGRAIAEAIAEHWEGLQND